jgi:short-subunit dehydrogenase
MAAFIPSGLAGIYTASKYAVRGLSEALRLTVHPYNIGVSVFCPGLINSTIYESEKIRPQSLSSPDNTAKSQLTMDRLPEVHKIGMSPEEVGEKVLAGIRRNDLYIFSHPEFEEELSEIFNEVLHALPKEEAPAERLAFERYRRDLVKKAKMEANR